MMNGKLIFLALAMAGGAAFAYVVGRNTRRVEAQQLKEDLHDWEDEGGSLAPPKVDAMSSPARTAPPLNRGGNQL